MKSKHEAGLKVKKTLTPPPQTSDLLRVVVHVIIGLGGMKGRGSVINPQNTTFPLTLMSRQLPSTTTIAPLCVISGRRQNNEHKGT